MESSCGTDHPHQRRHRRQAIVQRVKMALERLSSLDGGGNGDSTSAARDEWIQQSMHRVQHKMRQLDELQNLIGMQEDRTALLQHLKVQEQQDQQENERIHHLMLENQRLSTALQAAHAQIDSLMTLLAQGPSSSAHPQALLPVISSLSLEEEQHSSKPIKKDACSIHTDPTVEEEDASESECMLEEDSLGIALNC